MEILRVGEWGGRTYGCWLFPFPTASLIEAAGVPTTDSGEIDFDAAGVSRHKKVSFWIRFAEGESLTRGKVEEHLWTLAEKFFPAGQGWDVREGDLTLGQDWQSRVADHTDPECPIQAVALYVGKTVEASEFSEEEKETFRNLARQIAEKFYFLL